jgi:hypothetical protein
MTSEKALMHRDHDEHQRDYGVWLDDLSLWRQQHRSALEMLTHIQLQIVEGSDLLDEHERNIRALAKLTERRDRELTGGTVGSESSRATPLAHVQVNLDHEAACAAHQGIERRHQVVLNEITLLLDKVKNHLSGGF